MAPPGHILGFDLGYPFQTGAILSFTPHAVTAGSGWTGATSWPTSTGVGTGFTTPPTQSNTINGSGYNQRVIAESTHVYYDYAIDDSYYVTFHGGGDYARTGAITWQIYFESDTPQTFTQADYQYDPYRKVWGLPISFRPKAGFSGVARFYAKCIPANGQERMLTGEVWCNRSGTTGYYDRHANAIYVSGVNYNGSDSIGFAGIGTNDASVGTSINPNYRVQRAVQYASGAREGCYIYIKGAVVDDTNGASRPTTTVPCRIMPWPGCDTNQAKWGKTTRATIGAGGGDVNLFINKWEFYSVTIDSDTIVKMSGNSATRGRFNRCNFLSGLSVDLDQWGYKKGIQQTVVTSNSQSWAQNSSGERNEMIDCTGSLYCAAGFQKSVGSTINFAWDAIYFANIAAGQKNFAVIGSRYYGADFAYSRAHEDEQLTVDNVWLDANGWTVCTFTTAGAVSNLVFETHIQFVTGAQTSELWGGQTATSSYPTGPNAQCGALVGPSSVPTGFPLGAFNRIYIKGDYSATIAVGDKFRVYNWAHKDTGQFTPLAATPVGNLAPWFENILYHNSIFVSNDAQWFLNQVGNIAQANIGGTLTSVGTAVTLSQANTAISVGQDFVLTSGAQSGERRQITVVNSTTSFTIASAFSVDQSVGVSARYEDIVSTVGTTMTCNASRVFNPGHVIHIEAGAQNDQYAFIVSGGAGTWTLDRAFGANQSNVLISVGNSIKDVLIENCIFDTLATPDYQGQWQVGAINATMVHSTMTGPTGGTSGQTLLTQSSAGFGLQDWQARNCLFRSMDGVGGGFPASGGYTIDVNHFSQGTARGTNTTTGAPAFAATGSVTSSYYPTAAAVGTCAAVYLPYDRLGNVRSVGSKVGASASG